MKPDRCTKLDADRCRCLRPEHDAKTPCDFPYTPWAEALSVSYARQVAERQRLTGEQPR